MTWQFHTELCLFWKYNYSFDKQTLWYMRDNMHGLVDWNTWNILKRSLEMQVVQKFHKNEQFTGLLPLPPIYTGWDLVIIK